MKFFQLRFILPVFIFCTVSINIIAQSTIMNDKIVLKTGEVFSGEIVAQTSEIIMIKTPDGGRFQFPVSSIKSIEKISASEIVSSLTDTLKNDHHFMSGNLCVMVDLSGNFSKGISSFQWSPGVEASMSIGTKKLFDQTIFAGLGASYKTISIKSTNETLSFIPVFIRLQSNNLKKRRTSPYLSLDAGYAFSANTNFSGGTFAKLSSGVIHKISYKTFLSGGLYTRIQGFNGNLTKTHLNNEVTYKGNSSIFELGVKTGFQF